MGRWQAGAGKGEMGLFGRAAVGTGAANKGCSGNGGSWYRLEIAEQRLGEQQHVAWIDLPRRRDHQPVGPVLIFQPRDAVLTSQ